MMDISLYFSIYLYTYIPLKNYNCFNIFYLRQNIILFSPKYVGLSFYLDHYNSIAVFIDWIVHAMLLLYQTDFKLVSLSIHIWLLNEENHIALKNSCILYNKRQISK